MPSTEVLSYERVEEILLICFTKSGDAEVMTLVVDGIVHGYSFSLPRLEECREVIEALLDELPDEFKEEFGRGQSFANMCYDRHGCQWVDSHMLMEALMALGIAIDRIEQLPAPPYASSNLPYIRIKRKT